MVESARSEKALRRYMDAMDRVSSPQCLGLGAREFLEVLKSPGTIVATSFDGSETYDLPVLVPIDRLYWYN